MNYILKFIPEIENDALHAYTWYEEKSIGLGEEFLQLFYKKSKEISQNPLIHKCLLNNFRRKLLNKFPYAIYFQIKNDIITVYGLFHCARNPKFIQNALINR